MKRANTFDDLTQIMDEKDSNMQLLKKLPKMMKIPKISKITTPKRSKSRSPQPSNSEISNSTPEKDKSASPSTSPAQVSQTPRVIPAESNASKARDHYNALPQVPLNERSFTSIANLRGFNNYVKSILMNDFQKRIGPLGQKGAKILDLGCGKGGDLRKWGLSNPSHVVCVDIADKSIEDCKRRYDEKRQTELHFDANFIVADLTRDSLSEKLREDGIPDIEFDLTSCQFVLHYSFESEPQCKQMLRNAVSHLKPGGFFFGTIPRSNYLVKRYRSLPPGKSKFGNDLYHVDFLEGGITEFPLFGSKYVFYLDGAVEGLSEYLIHFPLLKRMMADLGMECVLERPFSEYIYQGDSLKDVYVLSRTRGLNDQGTISEREWEVVSCYMVFGFRKKSDDEIDDERNRKRPRKHTED